MRRSAARTTVIGSTQTRSSGAPLDRPGEAFARTSRSASAPWRFMPTDWRADAGGGPAALAPVAGEAGDVRLDDNRFADAVGMHAIPDGVDRPERLVPHHPRSHGHAPRAAEDAKV